jgi:hypothetical protein
MAVPKDRVDHIDVTGERSLSFRKAILLGSLNLEEEGNTFLQNVWKFSSILTASHCKNTAVTTSNVLNHYIIFIWPKVKEHSTEALLRNNLWLASHTY